MQASLSPLRYNQLQEAQRSPTTGRQNLEFPPPSPHFPLARSKKEWTSTLAMPPQGRPGKYSSKIPRCPECALQPLQICPSQNSFLRSVWLLGPAMRSNLLE